MSNNDLSSIKQGLADLGELLDQINSREAKSAEILDRSISGNKIHGGKITRFHSVGIRDDSDSLQLLVTPEGIVTDSVETDLIKGDLTVDGGLKVNGGIVAEKLHVNELTADVRNERSSPLEFVATETDSIYGKGLHWKGLDTTKQLVFIANPDRILSSEHVDVQKDKSYMIDGLEVLSADSLGTTVTKSNLKQLGLLHNLAVQGDVRVDEFLYYFAGSQRLGFNTEEPNGMLSLVSLDAEFIIDPEGESVKVGTFTNNDVSFITDDITRLTITANGSIVAGTPGADSAKVNIYGKLGIGVNKVDQDVSLSVAGPVKQEGKKFEVGTSAPDSGSYAKGDIVWNQNPNPTGYVGWICVREGTPGVWKSFGQISS